MPLKDVSYTSDIYTNQFYRRRPSSFRHLITLLCAAVSLNDDFPTTTTTTPFVRLKASLSSSLFLFLILSLQKPVL